MENMSSTDAAEAFRKGEISFETYQDLYASPSTQDDSSSTSDWWSSSSEVSTVDQINKSDKQIFVNQMPVGAEDGNHGLLSRLAAMLGIVHTNVSVESDTKKTTSGMGRDKDKGNGDMPIGMETKSTEQTARNEAEAQHGHLKKVPVSEYKGGAYKDADPEVLQKLLDEQVADGASTGTYGALIETKEGLIRPNICWSHSSDNLFSALPQAEQERRKKENAASYERLGKMLRDPEDLLGGSL